MWTYAPNDSSCTRPACSGHRDHHSGVVTKQMQDKGAITMLQFEPAVTDKKTSKPVEFVIFCGLRRRISPRSPSAADVAVGKRVRLLGTLSAAGNGQATLGSCVLQKQGADK